MYNFFLNKARASIVALAVWMLLLLPYAAHAQVVTQLPIYADNTAGVVKDLGNGPIELKILQGSAQIFTMTSSGIGSGSTTSITLTASAAANPPCIGCAISGGTLGPTSIVTAFNGTTGITTNTSQTVAASTPLTWGLACPSPFTTAPGGSIVVQAGVGGDLPLYTLARVCAAGQFAAGATLLSFPIGAH